MADYIDPLEEFIPTTPREMAEQIRDEYVQGANTAKRVGDCILAMLDENERILEQTTHFMDDVKRDYAQFISEKSAEIETAIRNAESATKEAKKQADSASGAAELARKNATNAASQASAAGAAASRANEAASRANAAAADAEKGREEWEAQKKDVQNGIAHLNQIGEEAQTTFEELQGEQRTAIGQAQQATANANATSQRIEEDWDTKSEEWNNQISTAVLVSSNVSLKAEKVNAELNGSVVTITNRNGESKSIDLKDATYESRLSAVEQNDQAQDTKLTELRREVGKNSEKVTELSSIIGSQKYPFVPTILSTLQINSDGEIVSAASTSNKVSYIKVAKGKQYKVSVTALSSATSIYVSRIAIYDDIPSIGEECVDRSLVTFTVPLNSATIQNIIAPIDGYLAIFYLSNRYSVDICLEINDIERLASYNYLTPEMFGAKGDGITDDTIAIQKVIDIANGTSIKFNGKYFFNQIHLRSNTHIVLGEGCELRSNYVGTGNLDGAISAQGTIGSLHGAGVASGNRITNVGHYSVGDVIEMFSQDESNNGRGLFRIINKTDSYYFLDSPICHNDTRYNALVTPLTDISIIGCGNKFTMINDGHAYGDYINLRYCVGAYIKGLHFNEGDGRGVNLHECLDTMVEDCSWSALGVDVDNEDAPSFEAFIDVFGSHTQFKNCNVFNSRGGIDFAGSIHSKAMNCKLYNARLRTHGMGCCDISFINCDVFKNKSIGNAITFGNGSFRMRDTNIRVQGCNLYGGGNTCYLCYGTNNVFFDHCSFNNATHAIKGQDSSKEDGQPNYYAENIYINQCMKNDLSGSCFLHAFDGLFIDGIIQDSPESLVFDNAMIKG